MPPFTIFEFGPFRLDPGQKTLHREGQPVTLTPKAFDTLLVLVLNPHRLMTKEELCSAVWPDTHLEASNLAHQVLAVRRALGDDSETNHYLQTVPRRGYRFIAEIKEIHESGAPAPMPGLRAAWNPLHWLPLAALLLLCILAGFFFSRRSGTVAANAPIHAIAVLPLRDLSGDKTQQYFVDGITESLTTELAKVGSLKVISSNSAMQYRDSHKSTPEIGRELHVDAVVEGSVQRSGDRVRITAELVDTRTDTHLWAEQYDRDLRDVLTLEQEVARRVVQQIDANITQPEHHSLATAQRIDPQAHQAYLKGRFAWNRRTARDYQDAIGFFREAIAHDPGYAAAYAGMADAYALLASAHSSSIDRSEEMERARAAAQRAIELDPSSAEAHASLGFVLMHYDWNFAGAEKEYLRSLRLNPSYTTAHQWYAYDLFAMGDIQRGLEENERALRSDPLSLIVATDRGELLRYARRYDESIRQLQDVLKMDPDFALAHIFLALDYADTHDFGNAMQHMQRAIELDPKTFGTRADLAWVEARAGMRSQAVSTLHQLERSGRPEMSGWSLATVYCALGDHRDAIEELTRAVAEHDGSLILLRSDPMWDGIRNDPEFQHLLHRVGLS